MTKKIESDLDEKLSWLTDAVMIWLESYWYDPIARLWNRMPFWLYITTLPLLVFALAVPPLLISVVVFIPYVLVIIGVLSLVGIL